jgi:hypothetical protein
MTLTRIGRFQVERALGSGTFATVWLARDEDLDAWVAIKLLAENWTLNEDARRRFLDEARAMRRLDSERIVRVHEVGHLDDGRPYMVMEFADRGTLDDRIRLRAQLNRPFSAGEAVRLSVEIAECLIAVHDLRIVHRDVKPSNVLFRSLPAERLQALRRDGLPAAGERTLLGDFGIARRMEWPLGHTMVVGSPFYMAPEQGDPMRARLVDARSDLYSAAAVLYELLAARVPFAFRSVTEMQRARLEDPMAQPPRIQEIRPDVPDSLASVLERGLALDPADRFASAWAWRDALRASIQGLPPQALRVEPPIEAAGRAAPGRETFSSPAPGVVVDRGAATPASRGTTTGVLAASAAATDVVSAAATDVISAAATDRVAADASATDLLPRSRTARLPDPAAARRPVVLPEAAPRRPVPRQVPEAVAGLETDDPIPARPDPPLQTGEAPPGGPPAPRMVRVRLAGAAALLAGAALALGAFLPWLTVGANGGIAGGLAGVSYWHGVVTLALGVVLVFAGAAMFRARLRRRAVGRSIIVLAAGLVAGCVAAFDAVKIGRPFHHLPGSLFSVLRHPPYAVGLYLTALAALVALLAGWKGIKRSLRIFP